ncbi:MAG: haloacid dehalogenase type II [Burkholderiales bacterium]|nr:haloacid dehalogenase type II [Burkholderiales bacterium]
MSSTISTYVFDAYGTLFDVHSAVARHAARIGPAAAEFSELWRARQVEYSWTSSLMGHKTDFWALTQLALDYSMQRFGIVDDTLRADLLSAYLELEAFPEVPQMLRSLKACGAQAVILSNGTSEMVNSAVRSAGLSGLIDRVMSVDEVGIFKPHASVYDLVPRRLAVSAHQISFQSCNPWDAAGAAHYGFRVVWVNRKGLPAEYPFAGERREVASLEGLASLWRGAHD